MFGSFGCGTAAPDSPLPMTVTSDLRNAAPNRGRRHLVANQVLAVAVEVVGELVVDVEAIDLLRSAA